MPNGMHWYVDPIQWYSAFFNILPADTTIYVARRKEWKAGKFRGDSTPIPRTLLTLRTAPRVRVCPGHMTDSWDIVFAVGQDAVHVPVHIYLLIKLLQSLKGPLEGG